jgi:hypothetical protein
MKSKSRLRRFGHAADGVTAQARTSYHQRILNTNHVFQFVFQRLRVKQKTRVTLPREYRALHGTWKWVAAALDPPPPIALTNHTFPAVARDL